MAGLLQQILGLLGLGRSPTRRHGKPPKSPQALRRSGLVRCKRCHTTLRRGTPRCPQCGTRVIESPLKGPPIAKLGLTDLQRSVLVAASNSESRSIHILPAKGSDEGEIKAGSLRLTGNDVLIAVEQLWQEGLVEPKDASSYVVTDKGKETVIQLDEPI